MLGMSVEPGGGYGRRTPAPSPPIAGRGPYADGSEPRLEELLSDPVTAAIMRCDKVSDASLRALMTEARAGLKSRTTA